MLLCPLYFLFPLEWKVEQNPKLEYQIDYIQPDDLRKDLLSSLPSTQPTIPQPDFWNCPVYVRWMGQLRENIMRMHHRAVGKDGHRHRPVFDACVPIVCEVVKS